MLLIISVQPIMMTNNTTPRMNCSQCFPNSVLSPAPFHLCSIACIPLAHFFYSHFLFPLLRNVKTVITYCWRVIMTVNFSLIKTNEDSRRVLTKGTKSWVAVVWRGEFHLPLVVQKPCKSTEYRAFSWRFRDSQVPLEDDQWGFLVSQV